MNPDLVFRVFAATIVITRVYLFLWPIPSPTVGAVRLHHWMYGVVLVVVSVIIRNSVILGIGLGLFADEVTWLMIGGANHKDNYSVISLLGTSLIVICAYFLRYRLFTSF